MPRIVITHAVKDRDRWLEGIAERVAAVPGARNVTDLLALDGSEQAALALDVDDVDAFVAMVASMPPDVAAQADSHGVPRRPGPPPAVVTAEARSAGPRRRPVRRCG